MTKDKAEKTAIRARMAKTGERYTAARHFLLDLHQPHLTHPAPELDDATRAADVSANVVADQSTSPAETPDLGLSHEAVLRATGKSWDEWLSILDGWGGTNRTHTEIARYLDEDHGVEGWWTQGVTVGYERARGMRVRHQQTDGYAISVSKTMAASPERVFAAFVEETVRDQWLDPGTLRQRTAVPHRSARFDVLLPGGVGTRIEVYLTEKGEAKASVAVQHSKLAGPDDLEPWRAFWKERLARLAEMLKAS